MFLIKMRKRLIYLFFIFFCVSFVFAQEQFKESIQIKLLKSYYYDIVNHKVVLKPNKINAFVPELHKKILKVYGKSFVGENGKVIFQIIIKPSTGKISDYLIYRNNGNKVFKKHIKEFFEKLLKEKLLYSTNGKTYEFKFLLSIKSGKRINNIENFLVFGKNKTIKNPYKYYLYYLIKYKKYSKDLIKKELNSKQVTIAKAMLYYLYFTYNKPNKKYSQRYYNDLLNHSYKIAGKIESVFLGEQLIKEGKYFKILEMLSSNSCELIADNLLKKVCYYYVGFAKYMNNYDLFLLDLKKAKSLKPAKKLLQFIGF